MFVWLISHQLAIFPLDKPTAINQSVVIFS
jgi:hypothetical protein